MKKTPLHTVHKRLGARMVDFSGWEMPVQYSGVIEEHRAVREEAGLFDISHMGEIEITGPKALALVQKVTSNDASRLTTGQSHYSSLLTPEGTFVDDIYVYRLATDRFLLCVNASNADRDFQWITAHAIPGARVENRSDDYVLIALQGPLARKIVTDGPQKNRFDERTLFGAPVLLSGTGYTGEDGFEIFCRDADAEKIWTRLIDQGTPIGLKPCGLGARDTLRLEAAYPLYGHEIDRETDPFSARLGWIVKMEKGDFIGREALARRMQNRPRQKLVGLRMESRGIARQGYKIYSEATDEIGRITSGTYSPTLDQPIALGYVATQFAEIGTKIRVDIHHEKRHAVTVPLPFYRRGK